MLIKRSKVCRKEFDLVSIIISKDNKYNLFCLGIMVYRHVPVAVPCYDLTPITDSLLDPHSGIFKEPQLSWFDGR